MAAGERESGTDQGRVETLRPSDPLYRLGPPVSAEPSPLFEEPTLTARPARTEQPAPAHEPTRTTGEDAQAEVEMAAVDEARRNSVTATATPWWRDLVLALGAGVGVALMLRRTLVFTGLGLLVFVAIAVASFATQPRRGRITDDRAVGAGMLIYGVTLLPLTILLTFVPRDLPWWGLAGGGAIAAALVFAYSRALERYQNRRLTRGDHGPYDLS